MAWTDPKTWIDNVDVLSATNLNTHLRDNLKAVTEWTTYTPTWTATTTNPSLSNGQITAIRTNAGDVCHVAVYLLIGSGTTPGSGGWLIGLPETAVSAAVGAAIMYDSSTGNIESGIAYCGPNESAVRVRYVNPTTAGNIAAGAPWTWADGDYVSLSLTYRV